MGQKIIFFDIDGTLLDEEKYLPESTEDAIHELKNKGFIIAFATGRLPFMIESLRSKLGINTYICSSGQYVVVENELIYENPIKQNHLEALTDFANKRQHPLVYMSRDDAKANISYHPYINESFHTLKFDHPTFDNDFFRKEDILQSIVFCQNGEEVSYLNEFKNEFTFIRWHDKAVDILPGRGSKAKGVEMVIKKLGIKRQDVYAFGDALNDVEMLSFVENSVAMGNAVEEVKKAAKFITTDVESDGIANGLKLVGVLP